MGPHVFPSRGFRPQTSSWEEPFLFGRENEAFPWSGVCHPNPNGPPEAYRLLLPRPDFLSLGTLPHPAAHPLPALAYDVSLGESHTRQVVGGVKALGSGVQPRGSSALPSFFV